MDISPTEASALIQLHEATTGGLVLGSHLTIPPGYSGAVIKDGKALDMLPPGDYTLEASLLPNLMQALKRRPNPNDAPLPAAIFLVQTGVPFSLPWQGQTLLSKNPADGLTYTTLQGRFTGQIADPARFCTAAFHAGSKALSTGAASPAQVAEGFLRGTVPAQAAEAVERMNLPPEQVPMAREAIRAAAGQAAAQWLSSIGVNCLAFDLDSVAEPDRTPCAGCGSRTEPTGYGRFQRNISLIYLRFTAKKEGNFCVPCAWKTSAGYNGVMLVAGWWGIIGLILTPIYFVQNLYYLTRIVTGPKAAPRLGQAAATAEGTWPPAPTV